MLRANLANADCSRATLRGTQLRGAVLRDANLSEATLRDAQVEPEALAYAILTGTRMPDGNRLAGD